MTRQTQNYIIEQISNENVEEYSIELSLDITR